ncbi:GTP-binding protein Rhes precursor, partial [Daubentonia madagascariensis]
MMKTLSGGNCTFSVPAKNSYRMVVLGASRVGKSSIVSRFLNGRFEDQYTPTIEDFHRKVYNIRGDMYQLDILDTSGNHPFPAMRRLSILTGDVFILVFSLDNRESFDEVKRLQKQILEVKSCLKNKTKEAAELPMVICGNKNDHGELCRQVPTTEAELLVSGDENCAYFEVSAKKNTNVDEMFYVLFSMAKLPHEMSPRPAPQDLRAVRRCLPPQALLHAPHQGGGRLRHGLALCPPPQRQQRPQVHQGQGPPGGPGPREGQMHHPV